MMKLRSFSLFFILIALSAAVFVSCKKNNDAKTNIQITGIAPDSGPYSTTVTITGTGFSTNASENQVKFNGKDAVVEAATPSQLTVVVPKGAGTGPVSLTVGSNSATGPVFNYTLTVTVSTLAGATFGYPTGLTIDDQENIYVADSGDSRIYKVTPEGITSTFAGVNQVTGLAIDEQGNIYASNRWISKITPAGVVSVFAGGDMGFEDGQASTAKFSIPKGITVDASGDIYVADTYNNRIRKITAAGEVTTLAGDGTRGFADGLAGTAKFNSPKGITVDTQGNIYVADTYNNCIRKITKAGVVSTLAGDGKSGFADGNGSSAKFNYPIGLTIDTTGNIYVVDAGNYRIRKVTQAGEVTTLAGNGTFGFADGLGSSAKFNNTQGITIDFKGNIYVTGPGTQRIRKITQE